MKVIFTFVQNLLAIVAVPAREFYRTIGHSTVASAVILAGAGMFCVVWWGDVYTELQAPITEALAQHHNAQAEYYRILNKKEGMKLQIYSWRIADFHVTDEGVTVTFEPLPGATAVIGRWQIEKDTGIFRDDIPANHKGLFTLTIPRLDFGEAWVPGKVIWLHLVQVLEDGQRIYLQRPNREVTIPQEGG